MKKLNFILFAFLSLSVALSCSDKSSASKDSSFSVASAMDSNSSVLDFDHRCSQATASDGYLNSYAFFSNLSGDQKTLVLGQVRIGFISALVENKGVFVILNKVRMSGLETWSDKKVQVALQLVKTENSQVLTGDFIEETFQIDQKGAFDWETYRDQDEFTPSFLDFSNAQLDDESYQINLVLKRSDTGESFIAKGPSLEDFTEKTKDLIKPEYKELGLLQTLNPAEPGGLWGFFRQEYRERGCVDLRKKAENELDELFDSEDLKNTNSSNEKE